MRHLCLHPVYLKAQKMYVDCGTCRSCRMKRRQEWASRMTHEMSTSTKKQALFVTLTYDKEHLPKNGSVSVREMQTYIKRVRKSLPGSKFRYYLCGEYGELFARPHYHLVLVGLGMSAANVLWHAWEKSSPYCFKCEPARSRKAFSYVAGYTAKKLGTRFAKRFAAEHPGLRPPFQCVSLGFGRQFAMALPDKDSGTMLVDGKRVALPRYYRKLLDINIKNNPEFKAFCEQSQEDLYQHISEVYDEKTFFVGFQPVGSCLSFAGRSVTPYFFCCLRRCRDQSNEMLYQQSLNTRQFAIAA